ncbi:hypothetical protein ABPG74_001837 [Tetrahymena malaccensis]
MILSLLINNFIFYEIEYNQLQQQINLHCQTLQEKKFSSKLYDLLLQLDLQKQILIEQQASNLSNLLLKQICQQIFLQISLQIFLYLFLSIVESCLKHQLISLRVSE